TRAFLLAREGNAREAIRGLQVAIDKKPDSAAILNGAAWLNVLSADATAAERRRSVTLAERACQLTNNRQPVFLNTLAAAYASVGRFPEAILVTKRGLTLASGQGQAALSGELRRALGLYEAGRPYGPPPASQPSRGGGRS